MIDASSAGMDRQSLETRSLKFAKDVVRYCELVRAPGLQHATAQLLRASSGAAANYRASGRARSTREFVAKLGIVNEEADEAVYWLEYLDPTPSSRSEHERLMTESRELRAIFAASYGTARSNLNRRAPDR
jgi:four helix bundle protein